MPELPEVETVRRVLEPQLSGRRVIRAAASRPEVIARPAFPEFCRSVESSVIRGMGRRGKFLLFYLDRGATMILHLRMTGQLICVSTDFPIKRHTHVTFNLDNGMELRFIDTRRFGRLWLARPGEDDDFSGIGRLGPEPFGEEFSAALLERKLGGRAVTVKQGLLDQSVVAGIGNIYADETLFEAKIRPHTPAREIAKQGWKKLAAAVRLVLERAIAGNAVTPEEYLAYEGGEYRYNDFFVYGREGKACRVCGTVIERAKIGGRSSHYCPKCQK